MMNRPSTPRLSTTYFSRLPQLALRTDRKHERRGFPTIFFALRADRENRRRDHPVIGDNLWRSRIDPEQLAAILPLRNSVSVLFFSRHRNDKLGSGSDRQRRRDFPTSTIVGASSGPEDVVVSTAAWFGPCLMLHSERNFDDPWHPAFRIPPHGGIAVFIL